MMSPFPLQKAVPHEEQHDLVPKLDLLNVKCWSLDVGLF